MPEQMEILLKTERKPEAEAVFQLLDELSADEQKEMMLFIQGVRFARSADKFLKPRMPEKGTVAV